MKQSRMCKSNELCSNQIIVNEEIRGGIIMNLSKDTLKYCANQSVSDSVEAISKNCFSSIQMDVETISREYELLYNQLAIDDKKNNDIYHFGRLSAVMEIMRPLCHRQNEEDLFRQLMLNRRMLVQCILALGKSDEMMMFSNELCDKVNINHRSLGNIMRAQVKYSFIVSYQIDHEKLYCLSNRGKSFYDFIRSNQYLLKSSDNSI